MVWKNRDRAYLICIRFAILQLCFYPHIMVHISTKILRSLEIFSYFYRIVFGLITNVMYIVFTLTQFEMFSLGFSKKKYPQMQYAETVRKISVTKKNRKIEKRNVERTHTSKLLRM